MMFILYSMPQFFFFLFPLYVHVQHTARYSIIDRVDHIVEYTKKHRGAPYALMYNIIITSDLHCLSVETGMCVPV